MEISSPTKREFNILLLGETGVGKSTWINGFANYLTYQSLKEAESNETVCLIPASFNQFDDNYKEVKVLVGDDDANERSSPGQSCTKLPKSYVFPFDDVAIRLIDTPGIGDTRGIEKDKENFKNILTHIATLDELHCICILFKPDTARLTVLFEYCIKELLTNLHQDACRNVVTCFTNCRGTLYRPGDTLSTLREFIRDKTTQLELSKETIYCIDNECVRYLAAIKSGLSFNSSQRSSYYESWKKSAKEIDRLMQHILSVMPHRIKNTRTVIDARSMILAFTEPLAEISADIQKNLASIESCKQKLEIPNEELLPTNLQLSKFERKIIRLDRPIYVCISYKCAYDVTTGKETRMKYTCTEETKQLLETNCMNGTCTRCGCEKSSHTTIKYKYVTTESTADLPRTVSDSGQHIRILESKMTELEHDKKKIIIASAQFACFLKKYSILPYNSTALDYLNLLIKNKENDKEARRRLEQLRDEYEQEFHILDKALFDANSELLNLPTPNEVKT